MTLDIGFMEKAPRPEDISPLQAKKKKAFAQLHLQGKAIKVICEVTFNLLQTTPHSSCQEFDWQFLFIYILLYNICINVVNFSDWNFTVSASIFIDHKIICTTCYIQGRENGCQRNHLTGFGYLCPGNRRRSDDIFTALCINQEPAFWAAFLPYPQSLFWNISKSLLLVYLPATPYGPRNLPHLQLLTLEKSHLHNEIWYFHNCSLKQPMREGFGFFNSSETTLYLLILAGKDRSIKFLPTREKLWNVVSPGSFPIAW